MPHGCTNPGGRKKVKITTTMGRTLQDSEESKRFYLHQPGIIKDVFQETSENNKRCLDIGNHARKFQNAGPA